MQILWYIYKQGDSKELEKIQERVIKLVVNLNENYIVLSLS